MKSFVLGHNLTVLRAPLLGEIELPVPALACFVVMVDLAYVSFRMRKKRGKLLPIK